jgi:hypothetical protein
MLRALVDINMDSTYAIVIPSRELVYFKFWKSFRRSFQVSAIAFLIGLCGMFQYEGANYSEPAIIYANTCV